MTTAEDEDWWASTVVREEAEPAGAERADPSRNLSRADLAALLPPLDLTKLGQPIPQPDWLVVDRIARGWLVLLGAKPGVGKTWLGLDLTVALTTCRPWLDHELPRPLRVLYLDAENGEDLALERLHQLGAREALVGDRLHYVTDSVDLPVRDIKRLASTIKAFRPDLVVIDTLASIAPTAERDTESSSAFLSAVWHLVRDHGASMLLLVHLRKTMQGAGRDDVLDAFRGAGHLVGSAHRAWSLEPIVNDKPVFLMHDVKARRGRKLDTIRVQVIDDEDAEIPTTRVEVDGIVNDVESGYDAFLANVLTYIDATSLGEAKSADIKMLPDAPPGRSVNDYLTRAVASGVLGRPRRGIYTRGGAQRLDLTAPEETP